MPMVSLKSRVHSYMLSLPRCFANDDDKISQCSTILQSLKNIYKISVIIRAGMKRT